MFKTTALDSVNNRYIDKDIGTSTPGTKIEAEDQNIQQDEIVNLIESASLTLDPTGGKRSQQAQAAFILGASASSMIDTGVAGTYVVDHVSSAVIPPDAFSEMDGVTVGFNPDKVNPGASTINYSGLGAKPATTRTGSVLTGGEMVGYVVFKYNLTSDRWELVLSSSTSQTADVTVTVGSGGDFATINEAITELTNKYPLYTNPRITATISLLAGFIMEEQILVWGLDLSWINIKGIDAITNIDSSFLTESPSSGDEAYGSNKRPAFGVYAGGTLPRISQLFDMQETVADVTEELTGVAAYGAGTGAEISRNCGVINSGSAGMIANFGATIHAYDTNFSGALGRGCFANSCSRIIANFADLTNAGSTAVHCTDASNIDVESADVSNAGLVGISANNAGVVNAKNVVAAGCPTGILAQNGSSIQAETSNATGCDIGARALICGTISVDGADLSGCTSFGITCEQGSNINADNANAQIGGSPGVNDVRVITGSLVNFSNGTGGVSTTINTLTADGIIFQ